MKKSLITGILILMFSLVVYAQDFTYDSKKDVWVGPGGSEYVKDSDRTFTYSLTQDKGTFGIYKSELNPSTWTIVDYRDGEVQSLTEWDPNWKKRIAVYRPGEKGFDELYQQATSAPTYVGVEDKFPEGREFETVGNSFDVISGGIIYRVGRVYEQNVVKNGNVVVTGISIKNSNGENIAGINEKGEYLVWNSEKKEWGRVTSSQFESRIREEYKNDLISKGVDAVEAEKLAAAEAERTAKEVEAQKVSSGLGTGFTGTVWQSIGLVLKAYDNYQGVGRFVLVAWPEYGEWSAKWRQQISQTFCGFVSIQNCFESVICGAILDVSPGNTIAGNVLFGRSPSGQPLAAGTINAERSLPIILKGMEKEKLQEVLGSELVLIGNQLINLSEVDTTTLPAQELRLYKIQYAITNTLDRELTYNIEVKGKTTRKVYPNDKKLKPGETAKKTIEAYKTTKYDEVCLTFKPSLPAGTGSTLLVAPKMVNQLCKPIIEYAGGATSTGNYAKEEKENTKTGGTPGGSW